MQIQLSEKVAEIVKAQVAFGAMRVPPSSSRISFCVLMNLTGSNLNGFAAK